MKVSTRPGSKVSLYTATTIVVANMIGTGVFTSLGYQAQSVPSPFPILMLWLVGGAIALCGALSYGELASRFPRSGGEYHYLSRIYHPIVGFLSGWTSITVGFAAPVALSCVAFGSYFFGFAPWLSVKFYAVIVLLLVTSVHLQSVYWSGFFQRYSTLIKVLFLLIFIFLGLWQGESIPYRGLSPKPYDWQVILSGGFAVSLAFVSFAYSGWNASVYIANEIDRPQWNVSLSLLAGTLVVAILYVLMHVVYLQHLRLDELAHWQAASPAPLDVGYLAAGSFLGEGSSKAISLMISLLLVSSISAMTWAGPRVAQVMGEDIQLFRFLSQRNRGDVPVYAICFQSAIALLLILTTTFESILYAIAFMLDTFTFLTVVGLFVARKRKLYDKKPEYTTWGYPWVPLIFLAGTAWTMYFLLVSRTSESIAALLWLGVGILVYRSTKNRIK